MIAIGSVTYICISVFFLFCTRNVILCISAHVLAWHQQYLELRQMLSKLVSWTSSMSMAGELSFCTVGDIDSVCLRLLTSHFTSQTFDTFLFLSFFFVVLFHWVLVLALADLLGWRITPPNQVHNAVSRCSGFVAVAPSYCGIDGVVLVANMLSQVSGQTPPPRQMSPLRDRCLSGQVPPRTRALLNTPCLSDWLSHICICALTYPCHKLLWHTRNIKCLFYCIVVYCKCRHCL